MKNFARKALPDLLVVAGFITIAIIYFFTPLTEGLVLGGHDTVAGMGQGHEQQLYHEATGQTTRWTNSIFSGMPTYQIAPSYGPTTLLGKVGWAIGLFTTGALNYLIVYLVGFYILMRSLNLRPAISALGSVLWAFSSYFFIIIAAGHIWKVNTLGFIPPTIAGMVLAYRGKYLWGALVTALFTALQVLSNHIQMTYYFLYLMAFITLAYGIEALVATRRAKAQAAAESEAGATVTPSRADAQGRVEASPLRRWIHATAAIAIGGIMGAAINLPNLYHTWEYSHESMRGPSELTAATPSATGGAATASGGLDRDYITMWSYGIDETMTLMIPMFKGGGSTNIYDRPDVQQLKGFDAFNEHAAAVYQATQGQIGYLPGTSQYWGEQPMTVGPVYVGAIVCFLFILGLFVVRGPMKWALLMATILSLLFAWGKNIMPLTDIFIDHLPMYNKFRTVSSALVVAEFTMPLLGILGLATVLRDHGAALTTRRGKLGLTLSLALTAGTCLLFTLAPSLADCISGQDMAVLDQLKQAGVPFDFCEEYRQAIVTLHENILSTSALRSLLLILAAAALITLHQRRPHNVPAAAVIAVIAALSLADMWNINRQYLNDSNFQSPDTRIAGFDKTPADATILADTDPDYRVLNLAAGNPFNESDNHTAYWHKSIGGYHAAKLHRYQDLIDRYLNNECQHLAKAVNDSYNIIARDSIALAHMTDDQFRTAVMSHVATDSVSPVLNMLNMKWLIIGQGGQYAFPNPAPNGNAWYLSTLSYVDTPNAEIDTLRHLDLKRQAVADRRFQTTLGAAYGNPATAPAAGAASDGIATLTSYQPNELHYTLDSREGGVVAFSEIYYPGWTATIDGQPAPLGRVNYILRALRVPKGKHEVILTFHPATLTATNAIAYSALTLLLLGFLYAGYRTYRRPRQ